MTESRPTRVFISYSHDSPEHKEQVLQLADRLNSEGVDCYLDQYIQNPPEGWDLWPYNQIEAADFVLLVCTAIYKRRAEGKEEPGKGLGSTWEAQIVTAAIYNKHARRNEKFIPVFFLPATKDDIPFFVSTVNHYDLTGEKNYLELYRRLTSQPWVTKPEPGHVVPMPRREGGPGSGKKFWNVPLERNPFFTGREKALQDVSEALKAGRRVALSGMSGSGKTQVAAEYAYQQRADYQAVLWVNADSAATALSGFAGLAVLLGLPEQKEKDLELAAQAVRRWFQESSGWLLVFDNVEDLSLVDQFVPAGAVGHAVVTTQAGPTGAFRRVPVDEMKQEEGALLVLRRGKLIGPEDKLEAAKGTDREAALGISREMGGLPLALDQAGAYIEETLESPMRYLELYRRRAPELLKLRGAAASGHERAAYVSFALGCERLAGKNPAAAELLRLCAFLHADGIAEEIIVEGAAELGPVLGPVAGDPFYLNGAIGSATRYSLVRRDAQAKTLSIHRLVQEVLRAEMGDAAERQWAERAVRVVNRAFPGGVEFADWPVCERLLPHAKACAAHVEQWRLEGREATRLLNRVGLYLQGRARYGEAEPLYRQALAIREKALGREHPDVATSQNNLASLLESMSQA